MLIKIKKLVIENQGYRRDIFLKNLYVNANNIISISDYDGLDSFLITEKSNFSGSSFSLVKVDHGSESEDIIALGTAEELFRTLEADPGKGLING